MPFILNSNLSDIDLSRPTLISTFQKVLDVSSAYRKKLSIALVSNLKIFFLLIGVKLIYIYW